MAMRYRGCNGQRDGKWCVRVRAQLQWLQTNRTEGMFLDLCACLAIALTCCLLRARADINSSLGVIENLLWPSPVPRLVYAMHIRRGTTSVSLRRAPTARGTQQRQWSSVNCAGAPEGCSFRGTARGSEWTAILHPKACSGPGRAARDCVPDSAEARERHARAHGVQASARGASAI
jgi:hypothetical protein